ncbi:hypothetical protein CGCF413_v001745 [Colletotrichum fructicola]|nr:hypothetical protein CGCF413_v001745 [Colletotrichum fructicola]
MDDEGIARNPAQRIARKPVPTHNTEAANEPLIDTAIRRDSVHEGSDAAINNDHGLEPQESGSSSHEPKGAGAEPRRSTRSLSILKDWWQEILWCIISLIAFAALVLVLKEFNQKPLPRWPSGITLNTIIAALSTIARTAFLIPVSEGLSQSKIVGILSALLLASAIATSTLTQFTVTYPSRNVTITSEGSAAAWRTPYYFWETAHQNSIRSIMAAPARGISKGLFSPVTEPISFKAPQCSTSNCTWPQFSTLAVCHHVTNVTHLAEIAVPERNQAPGTNISLTNGIALGVTHGYSTVLIEPGPTLSYKGTQMEEASLYNYFAIHGPGSGRKEVHVSEVILHWCINTYNAAVTNNNISVKRVMSHTEVSSGDIEWPNGGSGNISYLTSPLDAGNKYIFGGTGAAGIRTLLNDSLPSLTVDVGSNSIKDGSAMLLQGIRHAGNWQDAVGGMARNIAMGLTNSLLGAHSNVIGEALQSEVYVDVHWPWLALLAAQTLFSIIFLVLVVVETATSDIAVVKSSTLPAIFAINARGKAEMESRFQGGESAVDKDDHRLVPSGIGGELRKTGGKWLLAGK